MGFPDGSDGKETACNAGDLGSTLGSERFLGDRNGNPLQYSGLVNSMDRGAWWAQSMGSQTVEHDRVTSTFLIYFHLDLIDSRTVLRSSINVYVAHYRINSRLLPNTIGSVP